MVDHARYIMSIGFLLLSLVTSAISVTRDGIDVSLPKKIREEGVIFNILALSAGTADGDQDSERGGRVQACLSRLGVRFDIPHDL